MSWGVTRFLERLSDRLNPEASSQRMAAAFALLVGGAVLAVLGVGVVAFGDLFLPRPSWIREVGFMAAAGGLPVFLLGLVAALPSRWWEDALVAAGVLLTVGAVGLFSWLYPHQWHLTVQTPNGYAIGAYLLGVSMISAGTAGCLANYFIERVRITSAKEGEEQRGVSREEIERDMAWAERQGWSWGGVRQGRPDTRLVLEEDAQPLQFRGQGERVLVSEDPSEPDVSAAHALHELRGTQAAKRESTDDDVTDQVGYLKQLKQRKAEEQAEKRSSWGWRLRHPIQWLRGS